MKKQAVAWNVVTDGPVGWQVGALQTLQTSRHGPHQRGAAPQTCCRSSPGRPAARVCRLRPPAAPRRSPPGRRCGSAACGASRCPACRSCSPQNNNSKAGVHLRVCIRIANGFPAAAAAAAATEWHSFSNQQQPPYLKPRSCSFTSSTRRLKSSELSSGGASYRTVAKCSAG
jgi:hypothetical protein